MIFYSLIICHSAINLYFTFNECHSFVVVKKKTLNFHYQLVAKNETNTIKIAGILLTKRRISLYKKLGEINKSLLIIIGLFLFHTIFLRKSANAFNHFSN